jgi:hypothetical protein
MLSPAAREYIRTGHLAALSTLVETLPSRAPVLRVRSMATLAARIASSEPSVASSSLSGLMTLLWCGAANFLLLSRVLRSRCHLGMRLRIGTRSTSRSPRLAPTTSVYERYVRGWPDAMVKIRVALRRQACLTRMAASLALVVSK